MTSSACTLYLANSTIPNAGLGIFTAAPLKVGDTVGEGDVCIPLVDISDFYANSDIQGPLQDYVWDGSVMGMYFEVESEESISAFYPGADAAVNANPYLNNVGKALPTHDTAGLHRLKDPSVGSFTPYYGGTTPVTRDIPMGGELFKDYGDDWFLSREAVLGPVPTHSDCDAMNQLLKSFTKLSPRLRPLMHEFMDSMRSTWNVFRALPPSMQDSITAGRDGLQSLHQNTARRSVEWLQKNGKCIDNIIARNSTIPGAGRGAFARRPISEGTIITASPLVHIVDRAYIAVEGNDNQKLQLLLNYCFGHPQSTLLLCPYGSGINFINHSSDRNEINVRIQWTKSGSTSHDDASFTMTLDEMKAKLTPGLAFDYVATRHIGEGEELFMDYGPQWEEAWTSHVQNWDPPPSYSEYRNAQQVNQSAPILRTVKEQADNPYPPNLETRCHSNIVEQRYFAELDFPWQYEYDGVNMPHIGRPCKVIRRHERDNRVSYDVSVTVRRYTEDEDTVKIYHMPVQRVPRPAIRFFDGPLTSDIHLDEAFRHEIMIPDSMFPQVWKDREDQRGTRQD